MKKITIKNEQEINFNNKKIKRITIRLFILFLLLFLMIITFMIYYKKKKIFKLEKKNNRLKNRNKNNKGEEIRELKRKINQLETKLLINEVEFNHTLIDYLNRIKKYNHSLNNDINLNISYKNKLLININETYTNNGVVNINEIEAKIEGGRKWYKNFDKSTEINIGFQLDPSYVLRTMMTLASIIDTQKPRTKLRLHFAVVLGFNAENMLKIYSLREKLREDVEYNFYNAKIVENDFKGMHPKGPGAVAKILLPHLLPDDIEKLLVFDTGDVLVLRDLSEMYNWNISDYLYMGAPDTCIGRIAKISKQPFKVYINVGHFLLNVKKKKKGKNV